MKISKNTFDSILEENRHLATLTDPRLKEFAMKALKSYGTPEDVDTASEIADVMIAMFTKMKQVNEQNRPIWIECLITAAFVHNLFYDGTLPSIFMVREKLTPLAEECDVPINGAALIFQAVEASLGNDMPVESCQPGAGTPNAIFAWACWFVEEWNGNRKLPECRAVK